MNAKRRMMAAAILAGLACTAGGDEPTTGPAAGPATQPTTRPSERPRKTIAGITISRETTYIDGPLNADGTVNYVAYLNRKYSEGVTPDNNAAVLLLRALGPEMVPESTRLMTFARLRMRPLPVRGEYFVDLDEYVESLLAEQRARLEDMPEGLDEDEWYGDGPEGVATAQRDKAMDGPWTAQQYPVVAEWLKANARPLDLIVEATNRPKYYMPSVSESFPPQMIDTLMPSLNRHREAARALTARAMLRNGSGDIEGARCDLLAVRRFARHVSHDVTLISRLVGTAIEALGAQATRDLVLSSALSSEDMKALLAQLNGLPPMPDMIEALDEGERLMHLDCVMMLTRGAPVDTARQIVNPMGAPVSDQRPALPPDLVFDWDTMLRRFNHLWDREAAALRRPAYGGRHEAFDAMETELIAASRRAGGWNMAGRAIGAAVSMPITKKPMTLMVSDLLATLLMPSLGRALTLQERAEMDAELVRVAAALAVHRAERGRYPDELEALTPGLIEKVPTDVFSGKPLVYKPTAEGDGYVLYSVGENLTDDGGVDDYEEGDIVVKTE